MHERTLKEVRLQVDIKDIATKALHGIVEG